MYSQKLHILRIVLQRPEKQATAPGLDKGAEMPPDTVCRTVRQYNKEAIPTEDMEKLQEIAEDYSKVKKYVYQRFGGIGSLWKLYPGYTVQNEMTGSGLRAELGLPSVYFYLAVFDALGDIKGQWTRTKSNILKLIGQNENLTEEEKHYLRFLLKVNNAFTAVLNQQPIKELRLPREIQKKYEALAAQADTEMLHRYLCRQVRKYHTLPYYSFSGDAGKNEREQKRQAVGFSIAERAYRYGDNGREKGIYISTKESRKRIFVPLTDSNQYKSQLQVQLFPEEKRLILRQWALKIKSSIKNEIQTRLEVVFLPYKASMWDSLESVWKAADADPNCDAYVIPIPYYDKKPDGSFGEMHHEFSQYPSDIPLLWYEDYDFEKRRPDMIYIHNPYDECNYVTSVHPFFYSKNLKKFTEKLIYIPYFIL